MALPDLRTLAHWWRSEIARLDQHEVIARVRDESGWDGRYVFMVLMSAGIAILGLLLSSPAVVIGAMLISPLMGPIIGLGFGLATIDAAEIRRSAVALAAGSALAVGFTALIVLVSPLQNVTSELAARTRPNLFDLVVAILSALAGTYATIRGRAGTVVGVAIATALMPPLATMGFGVATFNATVAGGATLLFLTNFVAIALTAAVMARLHGFARELSPRQTALGTIIVIGAFAALALPLGLSLRQIAWETTASREVRAALGELFGGKARLSQVEIDFAARPIAVEATALTPQYRADANRRAEALLGERLGQPVSVAIEQYRVGVAEADAAQLADAQGARKAAEARAAELVDYLALVAGVAPGDVLIDRSARRAEVRAAALPGAGLGTYRALEARVAAGAPGWQVTIVPPAGRLPDVAIVNDAPDSAAIATALWGAARRGLALAVRGRAEDAVRVAEALRSGGADATVVPDGGSDRADGIVRLDWRIPAPSEDGPPPASAPAPRR